jgi:hypothetical protein
MNLDSAPCRNVGKKIVTHKGKYQVGFVANGERGVSSRAEQSHNFLRLAVYRQSVRLGDKPLKTHDQYFLFN